MELTATFIGVVTTVSILVSGILSPFSTLSNTLGSLRGTSKGFRALPKVDLQDQPTLGKQNHHHVMIHAKIGHYPDSKFPGFPTGTVQITQFHDGRMDISYNVKNVESGCPRNLDIPNACGGHIHDGSQCDDASTILGHFFDSEEFQGGDPWASSVYDSDSDGKATGVVTLSGGNGFGATRNTGKVFVMHAADGSRIACGVLK